MKICSITGNEMSEGWVFGNGTFYTSTFDLTLAECRKDRDAILFQLDERIAIQEPWESNSFKEALEKAKRGEESDEELFFIAYQTGYVYYTEWEEDEDDE